MTSTRPIPTPLHIRWRRARERLLPAVVFTASIIGAGLLWGRQGAIPNLVGEAEIITVELRSGVDGLLQSLPTQPLDAFDRVRAGQFVAQLDDSASLAEHATLLAELARLRAVLTATERRLEADAAAFQIDSDTLAHRRIIDVERLRLEVVELHARIGRDDIRLRRAEVLFNAANAAFAAAAESRVIVDELGLLRDEIIEQLAGYRTTLAETELQLAAAELRRAHLVETTALGDADALLEPLRAALAVQDARIRELQVASLALTLRSPIDGVIQAIHSRPGQPVATGTPIMTIASDETRYIVAYVREVHGLRPMVGTNVIARQRGTKSQPFEARIAQVGVALEPVPPHHLRIPSRPEWGLPVRIEIPDDITLTPGELVDLRFTAGS